MIHWYRDNKPLAGAESVLYDEVSGVTTSHLERHSGNYSCVVSNVYPPECDHNDIRSVYLPPNIEAEVLCRVLSQPAPTDTYQS